MIFSNDNDDNNNNNNNNNNNSVTLGTQSVWKGRCKSLRKLISGP